MWILQKQGYVGPLRIGEKEAKLDLFVGPIDTGLGLILNPNPFINNKTQLPHETLALPLFHRLLIEFEAMNS